MPYNAASARAQPELRRRPSRGHFVRRMRIGAIADEAAEANRLTASLAGLAVALMLVVAGLFLIQHLRDKAQIEDCLMSGRLNCDATLVTLRH